MAHSLLVTSPAGDRSTACIRTQWPDLGGEGEKRGPINIAGCLDTSGSMMCNKLNTAKSAFKSLLRHMPEGSTSTLVRFDDHADVVYKPTTLRIDAPIDAIYTNGSTNLGAGLVKTLEIIKSMPADRPVTVVVLTDGHANRGAKTPEDLAALIEEHSTGREIQFRFLGIGADYNEEMLAALCALIPNAIMSHCDDSDVAEGVGEMVGLCMSTVASLSSTASPPRAPPPSLGPATRSRWWRCRDRRRQTPTS